MASHAATSKVGTKPVSPSHSPAPKTSKSPTGIAPAPIHPAPVHQYGRHSPSDGGYDDEKKGDVTINIHDVNESHPETPHPGAPPPDPLQIYHTALGMPAPKPVKPPKPTKTAPNPPHPEQPKLTPANKGIYAQVLSCERTARFKYFFCDIVVTLAMFLQIVVGASVTAFGAGKASPILITAFGAANTALASLLAVLKSQGLPNRIRQDWNLWRELREFIAEKEREIDLVVSGKVEGRIEDLDVWGTVRLVEEKYQTIRLTCEANRPDTYIRVPQPNKRD